MRAWVSGQWVSGFLDYHGGPDDLRIEVVGWRKLAPVSDLYFERERRLGVVLNYLREIGPRGVVRRVRSRQAERLRNEKFVSCGIGQVVNGPSVAFVATSHPSCVDRVTVPKQLAFPLERELETAVPTEVGAVRYVDAYDPDPIWDELAGWSPFAGTTLGDELVARARTRTIDLLASTGWAEAVRLPTEKGAWQARQERVAEPRSGRPPRATLFGLGNYAKTTILPNVKDLIEVDEIHEVDPLQVGPAPTNDVTWSTSPLPESRSGHEAFLIAGYHHSHAPLAAAALHSGAAAVVEKPLAVTRRDLDTLLAAVRATGGSLFACFHKRYSSLNRMVREDLGLGDGAAVDYHCIVFEERLPRRHWYRWPASGTRVVSNGCHWTDHFLFLNDFSPTKNFSIVRAGNGAVNATVELENGALFTMLLTDTGSPRVGVRDHVELRRGDRTVVMQDGSRYVAEDSRKVFRRTRINKLSAYRDMYRAIAAAVKDRTDGDSVESIEATAALTLALEEEMISAGAPRAPHRT